MPTHTEAERFWEDYGKLSTEERRQFRRAVRALIVDLRAGKRIRHDLRPKRIHFRGRHDLWEITWANDGRAVFMYGEPIREGQAHIVWLRVGTHAILRDPRG
jgi:hypothetical protein